jgi:maltooligosyltrehalose trehalohydrolase
MPSRATSLSLAGLGARPGKGGTATFRVAAPGAPAVILHLDEPGRPRRVRLVSEDHGLFQAEVQGVYPGARYRLELEGQGAFPDPASRFQPQGVHGPSELIDPSFAWRDHGWQGPDPDHLAVYELHVGTLTAEGTFRAAAARLPELVELGVTAVELMPLADFPGNRNWGYDPAALFAPARCYGRPEDLRWLVDEAHRLGLSVILDVVYNHLGPDGAYLAVFLPLFFSHAEGPWGRAVNLDGEGSEWVRAFFVESAVAWVREYHLDGLRLDATHTLRDRSAVHLAAEVAGHVRAAAREQGRRAIVIAEDERNLDRVVRPVEDRGWGLDGLWADDFHHQVRRAIAGDSHGYYRDFTGSTPDIAETVRKGWFYTGQHSAHAGGARGTDPSGIAPRKFLFCIQNHDQVGNRAYGSRLNADVELPAYLAAAMLLLSAPETPLLFMGQEWAASSPFLYFTDHEPELGRKVTEGRRREFEAFPEFADGESRRQIPDPQAASTFEASRLRWEEAAREPHAGVLRLHRALLAMRRRGGALSGLQPADARALDDHTVEIVRPPEGAEGPVTAVVRLRGEGTVRTGGGRHGEPVVLLSSEEADYQADPRPVAVEPDGDAWRITFARPGGVVLRWGARL